MKRAIPALALAALATCAAEDVRRTETVPIPGTALKTEMVYVPGGEGLRPFWIAAREVTWAEFDAFHEYPEDEKEDGVTRPSAGKNYLQLSGLPNGFLEPGRPLTNVRYLSAVAYCEWLSKRTGQVYRLPTEAEWERAWRLGGEKGGEPGEGTHPVGSREPNGLGVYDMVGNVWEYCLEPHSPPAYGPVLRGGAWNSPPRERHGTYRKTFEDSWSKSDPSRPYSVWWFRTGNSQGFRVVRVPGAEIGPGHVEIRGLKGREVVRKSGTVVTFFSEVTGEVVNWGDRAIDELAVKIYFLTPDGKPHLEDVIAHQTRRATVAVCYPVLRQSAHPGEQAKPLPPGGKRRFRVDVPLSFDEDGAEVALGRFGGRVMNLRFADR